jgi:hypothetical protein
MILRILASDGGLANRWATESSAASSLTEQTGARQQTQQKSTRRSSFAIMADSVG